MINGFITDLKLTISPHEMKRLQATEARDLTIFAHDANISLTYRLRQDKQYKCDEEGFVYGKKDFCQLLLLLNYI
jgi:hypothetical protein